VSGNTTEQVDPDPDPVVVLLDEIPGARERAHLGLAQAVAGETVPVDEL
jgi:hypothetical protein